MRLVDMDALPVVVRGKNHHRRYVFADITDAPTINAIPVEWIRGQMARCHENSAMYQTANTLLQLWQKEQEAR